MYTLDSPSACGSSLPQKRSPTIRNHHPPGRPTPYHSHPRLHATDLVRVQLGSEILGSSSSATLVGSALTFLERSAGDGRAWACAGGTESIRDRFLVTPIAVGGVGGAALLPTSPGGGRTSSSLSLSSPTVIQSNLPSSTSPAFSSTCERRSRRCL